MSGSVGSCNNGERSGSVSGSVDGNPIYDDLSIESSKINSNSNSNSNDYNIETDAERENKLFVGMLPKILNEQDVIDIFSCYGELKEAHLMRNQEGSSKGCAFVKFAKE